MGAAASVSSLAKRMMGSSSAAARSKCGAIDRHGPHHSAQKSTTTGMSLRAICLSKFAAVSSTGCRLNKAFLQVPHMGDSESRAAMTRLIVLQVRSEEHTSELQS